MTSDVKQRLTPTESLLYEACLAADNAIGESLDLEYGAGNDDAGDVKELASVSDKIGVALKTVERVATSRKS